MNKKFYLTDMPVWLALVLTATMLPRTILQDVGVLDENTLIYRIFALTPFAIWLAVALVRKSKKPFLDFLVLGVLYGLSLAVIHQILWGGSGSVGHNPPAAALNFASHFDSSMKDLAVRGFTVMISLVIGVGSGAMIGLLAKLSNLVRFKHAK